MGQPACENVILVTTDGLRWEELFTGAEDALIDKDHGGVEDVARTRRTYWSDSPQTRRRTLMPFFWSVIAKEGQVFGEPAHNSSVRCTNGQFFSYPGYNELLCGFGDPAIDSNDKKPNQNVSVLEWLNEKEPYQDRVAAFASWDVFPFILNANRSGVYVNAGWQPFEAMNASQEASIAQLNRIAAETPHYWQSVRFDVFTFHGAMAYLNAKKPRVFYLSLGETDDWCHAGRYDLYLDSARLVDNYLRELWQTIQSTPQYADKTALVLTTDHGRGSGSVGWKSHGSDLPGSDRMWMAALGPGVPPLGVRENVDVTQAQTAATVAHLLGEDFTVLDARIAEPLPLAAPSQ